MNKGLLPTNQGSGDPAKFQRSDGAWQIPGGATPWGPIFPAVGEFATSAVGTSSVSAGTLNAMNFTPWVAAQAATFDQITVYCDVNSTAGTLLMGVYGADSTGHPAILLASWGSVATGTTGAKTLAMSFQTAANTLYWVATVPQTSNCGTRHMANANVAWAQTTGISGNYAGTGITGVQQTGVSGALPSVPTPVEYFNGRHLQFWMRRAA